MRWRAPNRHPSGALHTVRRRHAAVHRVGYRPDPWNWTPWEYAGTDGRFHGRWDDPNGTWRTLYAGLSPLACYLEVLAVFRADPVVAEELDAIIDNADCDTCYPAAAAGSVPRSWCAPRLLASGRLAGIFAVPGHPESPPTLRARFLNEAKAFGLADLDAAAIRDSRPRALTQAISAWIYTLSSATAHRSRASNSLLATATTSRCGHSTNATPPAAHHRRSLRSAPTRCMSTTPICKRRCGYPA